MSANDLLVLLGYKEEQSTPAKTGTPAAPKPGEQCGTSCATPAKSATPAKFATPPKPVKKEPGKKSKDVYYAAEWYRNSSSFGIKRHKSGDKRSKSSA